MSKVPLIN